MLEALNNVGGKAKHYCLGCSEKVLKILSSNDMKYAYFTPHIKLYNEQPPPKLTHTTKGVDESGTYQGQ